MTKDDLKRHLWARSRPTAPAGTRSPEAMRRLFAVARDLPGDLPPLPDIFPDQLAPIVRIVNGERQLEMMRSACQDLRNSAARW